MGISEPDWNERIARADPDHHAWAVPVFFHGVNSAAFQIAGIIHPRLRTVLLPQELLNKKGATIRVAIGRPVSAESLSRRGTDREAIGISAAHEPFASPLGSQTLPLPDRPDSRPHCGPRGPIGAMRGEAEASPSTRSARSRRIPGIGGFGRGDPEHTARNRPSARDRFPQGGRRHRPIP